MLRSVALIYPEMERLCLLFFTLGLKRAFATEILLLRKRMRDHICEMNAFTAGKENEKNREESQQKGVLTFGKMSRKIGGRGRGREHSNILESGAEFVEALACQTSSRRFQHKELQVERQSSWGTARPVEIEKQFACA